MTLDFVMDLIDRREEFTMFRKLFLTFVMSIPLAGATASHVAIPVVIVMGIMIFFIVSVTTDRKETKDEKP
jgi:phosphotransferase system  glucose/maltose/N-acetylglucosamine-specific IIC component